MSRTELSRAENIRIAKAEGGIESDKHGRASDRFHRFANPLTSRQIKYSPLTPPTDLNAKLPQLYRSILTDHLCDKIAALKFSPVWDAIHGRDYTWADYFDVIPERPEETNPSLFDKWTNENPDSSQKLKMEWLQFLIEVKGQNETI